MEKIRYYLISYFSLDKDDQNTIGSGVASFRGGIVFKEVIERLKETKKFKEVSILSFQEIEKEIYDNN